MFSGYFKWAKLEIVKEKRHCIAATFNSEMLKVDRKGKFGGNLSGGKVTLFSKFEP